MQREEGRRYTTWSLWSCPQLPDMSSHVWISGRTVSSWNLFTHASSSPHSCVHHFQENILGFWYILTFYYGTVVIFWGQRVSEPRSFFLSNMWTGLSFCCPHCRQYCPPLPKLCVHTSPPFFSPTVALGYLSFTHFCQLCSWLNIVPTGVRVAGAGEEREMGAWARRGASFTSGSPF